MLLSPNALIATLLHKSIVHETSPGCHFLLDNSIHIDFFDKTLSGYYSRYSRKNLDTFWILLGALSDTWPPLHVATKAWQLRI